MVSTLLQVALGGALGASARYLSGHAIMRFAGPGFPFGTLFVNVLGSFVMGAFAVYAAERSATSLAPFVMTGILGGFTTFSAFSLDTLTLIERGETGLALLYVAGSVAVSIGALWLGLFVARGVFA
ncbi:CrcB protein [Palleronia aestuarii]|uniref:Fluoride-specific ion channel FluC n=1 Tax=Palleronia aestuarii TaxID=568105 RepID=A0A2W7MWF2_9RHOB|nr:fluoride efflux transporter CrcB [Palleronia aestuarii]PZX12278.1 CrcB protein [Palleronia aestuarii]